MKSILFPTDFSNASGAAFAYALHFADMFDTELVILHVYDLPIVETPPMPETAAEIYDIVELNQFESFKEQLPQMHEIAERRNMGHVKMRNILLYGDLVYNINKVCSEEKCDLIIMGTKGATGLKETFIGSTASSVMSHAKVPVLAIPEEAEYQNIKNIGFATQYRDKDNDALATTITIAEKIGAEIHCVYVDNQDNEDNSEERITEWKMHFRANPVTFHTVQDNDLEQALHDFTLDENLQMLVMRRHKRGFFEGLFHSSLTKKLAYHTKVPLLVFTDNQ